MTIFSFVSFCNYILNDKVCNALKAECKLLLADTYTMIVNFLKLKYSDLTGKRHGLFEKGM